MQHLNPDSVRRRRYWRWLALLLLPVTFVAGFVYCQIYYDPTQAHAIDLYESLRPQMTRREVWQIMTQYAESTKTGYNEGSCCIDGRFNLTYSFDNNGELANKVLLEFGDHSSMMPNWMVKTWLAVGFPANRVHLSWP